MTDLLVVGVGGFGRGVIDLALRGLHPEFETRVYRSIVAVDDSPRAEDLERLRSLEVEYRGAVADVRGEPDLDFVVGIGDPHVRARIADSLAAAGHRAATLVHPRAEVGSNCTFGAGTIVRAGTIISTNSHFGRHVHLNMGVVVGHDVVVEDFVSVNPRAVLSGNTRLGTRSLIGASATVLQGITIGTSATVGAAACVVRDVADNMTVKGVPAQ